MTFRRLAVPTYFGGLPASGYAYINNAVVGTPSVYDNGKVGGVNAGTFFIAFGEDATTLNTNRANKALAENCDFLDDLFNTSQVVMRSATGTTVGPTASFAITGDVYVGGSAETPAVVNDQHTRDGLIRIVDDAGNDILSTAGVPITVTKIHNGAAVSQVGVPADGFYTNPTIDLNANVPTATNYRIYYLVRRNLSDIIQNSPGEFFASQVRSLSRTPGYSMAKFADLYLNGFDDRYRRASTYDATPPSAWPGAAPAADTAGGGAWFVKDGFGITGYVQRGAGSGTVQGLLSGGRDHFAGAAFVALLDTDLTTDLGTPATNADRFAIGSGFVFVGGARTHFNDQNPNLPGFFGYAHMAVKRGNSAPAGDATYLLENDQTELTGDQLELIGTSWLYKSLGGSDRMAFVKGEDILVLKEIATGEYHYMTITEVSTPTDCTVRYLDGSHPTTVGTEDFDIVEWLTPMSYTADGAVSFYNELGLTNTLPPTHAGYLFAEPPGNRYTATPDADFLAPRRYTRMFGPNQLGTTKVLTWGGYNDLTPTAVDGGVYQELSWFYADGGAAFNGSVVANGAPTASAANDAVPVFQTTVAATNNKLLWETAGSAAGKVRMYVDTTGFIFTQNAEWTGTQWDRDNVAAASAHYNIKANGNMSIKEASAAANPITWSTSVRDVGKYVTQDLSITTSTPAWSNATSTWTTVTGLSKAVTLKTGDIVKVRAEVSYDKTGTTNGGQFQIAQGGTAIADSIRWTGTTAPNGILAVSTQFTAVADSSITFTLEGRLATAGADTLSTVGDGSLQVEVVRPG
jgi:hypothetical protein